MKGEKIFLKIPKVGEIYLRGVLEASNTGILAVSSKGRILYRNGLFSKLWHVPNKILNTGDDNKLLDFVLDQLKNPEEFITRVKELYASNKILTDLIEFKDGRIFERTSTPLLDEENILGRVWSFKDITKSRQAEKALLNVMEDLEKANTEIEVEKAKDEATLLSIGEGIIAIDPNGRIVVMNKVAEKLLGWKIEEAFGKLYNDVISLEDEKGTFVPPKERPLAKAFTLSTTTTTTTTSLYLLSKNKIKFPVAITVSPIILGNKIIGAVEVFRDITQEKAIDKAKTEFVSLASHQLRTPLGIMKWYLEALDQESYLKKAPEAIHKYFDEIYKNNERVLSLVRDLLSVSRIEQGKVKNASESVDPIKIVKEITEQLRLVANKKGVILKLTIQNQNIPSINIDVLRLHQVIENLIINAIEYSLAADSVDVILNKIGDNLLISVKDTGIGISKTDQENLFVKFFRSEKAAKHNPEGSGLGLYVVKSYVEGWGGKIAFESVEGVGSTFKISLPMEGVINK